MGLWLYGQGRPGQAAAVKANPLNRHDRMTFPLYGDKLVERADPAWRPAVKSTMNWVMRPAGLRAAADAKATQVGRGKAGFLTSPRERWGNYYYCLL